MASRFSTRATSDEYSAGDNVSLRGHFGTTRFENRDTGFVIGTFKPKDGEDVVCKGVIAGYAEGQTYMLDGTVVDDKTWGIQVNITRCIPVPPSDAEEMVAFLANCGVRGCGPATAKKIVKTFGDDTRDVLNNHAERLAEVHGVNAKLLGRLADELPKQLPKAEAIEFFCSHGISMSVVNAIISEYGARAKSVVSENPYVLTKIRGFAFTRADQLAMKLGVKMDAPNRLQAGITATVRWYCLNQGHTLVPKRVIMPVIYEKLGLDQEVTGDKVEKALADLVDAKRIVIVDDNLQLPFLHNSEESILKSLRYDISSTRPMVSEQKLADAMEAAQEDAPFRMTDEQSEAVRKAYTCRISLLTAAAGSGKSACMRFVTQTAEMLHIPFVLCSPTGRAAKNLSESCTPVGHEPLPAYTLHRALCIRVNQSDDTDMFSDDVMKTEESSSDASDAFRRARIVLCDETSMLDTQMAALLLRKCKGKNLVLIGDPNQLPSIGPGSVLDDMMHCDDIPATRLTRVFRQAEGSPVIAAANAVLAWQDPCDVSGIEFHECADSDVPATLERYVFPRIRDEKLGFQDIAFMSPMKTRTACSGVNGLNGFLRPVLNKSFVDVGEDDWKMQTGDFVSQRKNNYDVEHYNGDQGVVSGIGDKGEVHVEFFDDPDSDVIYDANEVNDNLMLAYASTIHRYQGSQCPTVVMVLTDSHYVMCNRNLLYTGITRAQERLILVGNETAFSRAAKNKKETLRYTGLKGMSLRA